VCTEAYDALRAGIDRPPLQPYGATNPAEFFAVATEAFFDTPQMLEAHEPRLYGVLRGYYHQDPAARSRRAPR
jgi:Mlc titration factor MtfA (ptsG expression regulator)